MALFENLQLYPRLVSTRNAKARALAALSWTHIDVHSGSFVALHNHPIGNKTMWSYDRTMSFQTLADRESAHILRNIVQTRHLRALDALLSKGLDPTLTYPGGDICMLEQAIQLGDVDMVALMISYGTDVTKYKMSGYETPLIVAIRHGHEKLVQLLVGRVDLLERNRALKAACAINNISIAQIIVAKGAMLGVEAVRAAIKSNDINMFNFLMSYSCALPSSLYITAIRLPGVTMLMALIHAGVKIPRNAIDCAMIHCHLSAAAILGAYGANMPLVASYRCTNPIMDWHRGHKDWTPMMFASSAGLQARLMELSLDSVLRGDLDPLFDITMNMETADLLARALMPWSERSHALYTKKLRSRVRLLLCLARATSFFPEVLWHYLIIPLVVKREISKSGKPAFARNRHSFIEY